jgi:sugar lactone lactonase YvrE
LSSPDGIASPPHRRHRVRRFSAVPASTERYGLGEGPVWDADRNRVLWVDINAGTVHAGTLVGEQVTHDVVLELAETVGAVAASRDGELLVAGARRLYSVSTQGVVSAGPQIIPDTVASRLNDGACDPEGRFLVGTLALDGRASEEKLVRINENGAVEVIDDDLGLSNGLAFTADGRRLYSIDTTSAIVWRRDYDPDTGAMGPRHQVLHFDDAEPDGMCLDEQEHLWIAMWGAGQVRCYSPDGEQHAVVDVAAPNTTSVAFVGPRLDTMLITTASGQLSDAQRAGAPDSGRLFTAQVGIRGLAVPMWAGTKR